LSTFWVVWCAAVLVFEAVGILLGGIVSGGWLYGLLFAGVAVKVTIDWLRLRRSSESAQTVADEMIGGTMVALLGLAFRGFRELEAWMNH
jgi:hypothetical protein